MGYLSSAWKSLTNRQLPWQLVTILGVSVAMMGLVMGGKSLGWWEMGELAAYDGSVRWKPAAPPDRRLLIVAISENDLNSLKTWPLPDRLIARTIKKLTDADAAIIGLDVFRPNPVNPGNDELVGIWKNNDRIVPGCHHRNLKNPGIAGPPGIVPEQLGFLDLLIDRDSIVRRALLFMARDPKSPCTSETSFALQLAQQYLMRRHNIQGEFDANDRFKLGNVIFRDLHAHDGGYHDAESGGYQILLNYRSRDRVADVVPISDILNDRVDPKLIKDRIVLIGSTASSLKDEFLTPYSAGRAEDANMPGVMVHAQIVSQIVGAVSDKQPLWWFVPDWVEVMWIGGWCLVGSTIAWYVRHPVRLFLAVGGASFLLVGGFVWAFVNAGWIPVIAPGIGLIGSGIAVLGLTSYQAQQRQREMVGLVEDRERAIAELKHLLSKTLPQGIAVDLPVSLPQPELPQPMLPLSPGAETTLPASAAGQETTLPLPLGAETSLPPSAGQETTLPLPPGAETTLPVSAGENVVPQVPIPKPPERGAMPADRLLDGRYQAEQTLGAGGFGVTYLARDTKRPGKPHCVIKQLVPARKDAGFVMLARRLFNTEAEILSKLGHHNQIPNLLAYFEHQQEFYLVQEFIDGTPLDRELETATEPWGEERAIDLLRQLLPVLGFIHSQHVIHRDLKPGNIIRERQRGKLVLIDFGAVKEIQPQTATDDDRTIAIGTRGYTPPEQYAGQPNYTSDIYSLGTIAIEALTNTHPRAIPVDEHTGNLLWRDLAIVSPELARVLDKMVAYHFRDRYQSATEVLIDLPG